MVKPKTHWKPPTVCLAIGLALAALPDRLDNAIRSCVVDLARPGQQAVSDATEQLASWRPFANHSPSTTGEQGKLEVARLEIQRLRLANMKLAGMASSPDPTAAANRAPVPPLVHPPLITTDLVAVRVLGRETIQEWLAGRILDRGHGLAQDSLVVEPGHSTLDLGIDSKLAQGQPAYSGRRVVGRISRVGRWTSTLQPVTDTRFRGLARLARVGQDRPIYSTRGMLEGTGDGFCRLTLVPATAAVSIGDTVFTDGRDQPDDWPMVYGTVVQARLPGEAPHWEIRVRPAADLNELKQVEVLTRRFNRKPVQSPGVLAQ